MRPTMAAGQVGRPGRRRACYRRLLIRGQAAAIIQRHVTGCMRAMTEGLAPKTIANVHGLLSAAVA